MLKVFFFLILLIPNLLLGSVESAAKRIQAHLLIGDPKSAVEEANRMLQDFPEDSLSYEWMLKSLAAFGDDSSMMHVWERFLSVFPEKAMEQDLLEEMCWGILNKGRYASGTTTQLICLIGAALTQDMRAVSFLLDGMRHSCAFIRAIAVELAALYRDYPLQQEICRLLKEEKVLDVRLKVIQALGKLHLEAYLPEFIQCIASPKTGAKEKLAAIEAIVEMRECIGMEELSVLAVSPRAGLRQLACEVIAICELKEALPLVIPLMRDLHPEVCAAALKTWGLLRQPVTADIQALAIGALDPLVGVTAAWVWMLDDPERAEQAMMIWLEHENAHVRAVAASAVTSCGPYGTCFAKKMVQKSKDPYVLVNLAIALAGQREECPTACKLLEDALLQGQDKWMLSENGLFETLEKSNLSHNPLIPNYPEVVNQKVRLELLNLLAILESPKAIDAIKSFLKQRKWGVTGLAAETLLEEGDETAIDLVRSLLQDPDQQIRLEAALVLASWAKDRTATTTLLEVYPTADRQLQLKILESLGRIGDKQAIPFLIQRLKEPSLMIRMVAASVLIQTLNH